MKHIFSLSLLGFAICTQSVIAETVNLTLVLHNVGDAGGNLRAGLYSEPGSFRKEDQALQIVSQPATAGDAKLVFKAVPAGRYAIMAYHDANEDNRLNLRLGMFPTEGYGLSNNPKVFGPPKFSDSAFDVADPESTIEIDLKY